MLAAGHWPAADQTLQLGVGQQDHQHLPAALGTALAQLVSQLPAGELSPARQCLHEGSDRVADRALIETVAVAELLAGDPLYPGTGQVEQPAGVLGPHEMPRGPQHVRAQDGTPVEEGRQVGLVRVRCARGHCPSRLTGVFCLHGQQRTYRLARRHGARRDQVLSSQPPASNIEVRHHAATLPDRTGTR